MLSHLDANRVNPAALFDRAGEFAAMFDSLRPP
jgi:hypothetical protein